MNKPLCTSWLLLGLALAAPAPAADRNPPPPAPAAGAPRQPPPAAPDTEKVAYLGIATSPMDRALAAQLKLPRGLGLTVVHVEAEAPAAALLKVHDVLTKVDDQLLFNYNQLAALIRMHRPGDEIVLSFFREGREQQGKAKLAERELSRRELEGGLRAFPGWPENPGGLLGPWEWGFRSQSPREPGNASRDNGPAGNGPPGDEHPEAAGEAFQPGQGVPLLPPLLPPPVVIRQFQRLNPDGSSVQVNSPGPGAYAVSIRDAAGKTLYSGMLHGPEHLEDIPESYRNQVRSLLQQAGSPPLQEHPAAPLP